MLIYSGAYRPVFTADLPAERRPAMMRARRAAIVVGSASAAAILATGIPARAAGTPDWHIVAAVHYGAAANASGYSAVVALAKDDAWVFGGTNPGGASSPAAEYWNGAAWRSSRLPPGLSGFIVAAGASSASNVWAVGDGYALRWDGTRWSVARMWPQTGQLTSVAAINRNDVWVFGSPTFSGDPGLGAWHFNGRSWIRATGLARSVYRASAVARHDIWAVTLGPRGGWVLRYDGRSWKRVRSAAAALANTQLNNILAVSRTRVWVSGITPASGQSGRLVLARWDGSRWKRFVAPWTVQQPERFASDGAGGIWIPVVTAGADPGTWILHLSRAGRWTRTPVPAGSAVGVGVGDLALIPGTTSLWGSGGLLTATGGDATIWGHLAVPGRRGTPAGAKNPWVGLIRAHTVLYHGAMRPPGAVRGRAGAVRSAARRAPAAD
jgi:hypothetical protein